jgi:hypothetical protein
MSVLLAGRPAVWLVVLLVLAMMSDRSGDASTMVAGAPSDDDAGDDVVPLKNDADRDGRLSFEEIAAFLQACGWRASGVGVGFLTTFFFFFPFFFSKRHWTTKNRRALICACCSTNSTLIATAIGPSRNFVNSNNRCAR